MTSLLTSVDEHNYADLFINNLNWGAPDQHPVNVLLEDGRTVVAHNVSSYKGLRVWTCDVRPGAAQEAKVDQALAKTSTDRLVIFYDGTKQTWRWPSRSSSGAGVTARPARHDYRNGSEDKNFEQKLQAIRLPDDVILDVSTVLSRVREAFDVEARNESKNASKLMARMYSSMESAYGHDYDTATRDHQISVTLARVLFLLFGDDTLMWQSADQFQSYLYQASRSDGSDTASALHRLFVVLNQPKGERPSDLSDLLSAFPYVNGGIFEEEVELPALGGDFRKAVLDAAAVDWSTISPAIFGSMFQSVRDAATRRELGEHYTSENNILKTLNPLFLDDLRLEFAAACSRDTDQKKINALNRLWSKLGSLRFMDPACGCGNFIIVAYRELRELELEILTALTDLRLGENSIALDADWTGTLKVTLDHFYGIELDEWPARIAGTAMFLVDRQCDLRLQDRFGQAPERLPIQRQPHIEVGNALELDWNTVCPASADVVVAGNPPFLGDHTRSVEQKAELQAVWGADVTLSRMDYVTGWYAKALKYFDSCSGGAWAFVSTNSICQGDPVARLFGPIFDGGWTIKFAHRTFAWTSEATKAAVVHCVIVGFSREPKSKPRLFSYSSLKGAPGEVEGVSTINAYLVDGPNVLVTKRSAPLNSTLVMPRYGSKPSDGGGLVVKPDSYQEVADDVIASKYLRPYVGTDELLYGLERWCLWLVEATEEELEASPVLKKRVSKVHESRLKSKADSTRKKASSAHLFGQRATIPTTAVLAIPEVSSENRPYMPVGHLAAGTVVSNKVYSAPDPTGFLFGVAASAMFITWQKTVGGRMKSDPSFSNTVVWNNIPLPPVSSAAEEAVSSAGQKVLAARRNTPAVNLAEMYDPRVMEASLLEAHTELDKVVDRAFGLDRAQPTELERQEVLFARYGELTGEGARS